MSHFRTTSELAEIVAGNFLGRVARSGNSASTGPSACKPWTVRHGRGPRQWVGVLAGRCFCRRARRGYA